MQRIIVKSKAARRLQQGERLIQTADLVTPEVETQLTEGTWVQVISPHKESLGSLLVARQQKGLGWLFSLDIITSERQAKSHMQQRVIDAVQQRQTWGLLQATTQLTTCRLFNGAGDGLGGVTIDWYAGYAQINWYAAGVYQYHEAIKAGLKASLPELKGIYETKRFGDMEVAPAITFEGLTPALQPLVVTENGVQYAIHLGEEWMTGLFLDQREVRQYVMELAAGQSVLNLFSYTGAFSVAAALGGASQTVSVDVANRSLPRTSENFQLNGIEAPSPQHELRVQDVFDYIKLAERKHLSFDLVVCDPPSFARTKKFRFSAAQNYAALATRLFSLVAPGGYAVLSTNHSGYALAKFRHDLSQSANGEFELVQTFGLPIDFPVTKDKTTDYLKVLVFKRK